MLEFDDKSDPVQPARRALKSRAARGFIRGAAFKKIRV
jgi:hypothetical protein